jgi:TatD DNase family protein
VIDSHCHLADQAFAGDLDAVIARAQAAGVTGVVCILSADEPDEVAHAATVADKWPAVRFAAGIHPHRAGAYAGRAEEAARLALEAVQARQGVALGEIGLDYHYDFAPRVVQRDVFAAQLDAAVRAGLPVVIHTREASDDTFDLLAGAGPGLRSVMHCFTGSKDEARRALDLGAVISLAGILTFPKAETLRDVARFVPEDRLLVETDAPFLAPVPYRGKRNEPAWVMQTLAALAAARGTTVDAMAAAIKNTSGMFLGA